MLEQRVVQKKTLAENVGTVQNQSGVKHTHTEIYFTCSY
jgi:hypothetical protein